MVEAPEDDALLSEVPASEAPESEPQVVSVDPAADGDAPTCLAPLPLVDADDWPTETMLPEIEVDFEEPDEDVVPGPPSVPGDQAPSHDDSALTPTGSPTGSPMGAPAVAPPPARPAQNSWLAIVPPFVPEGDGGGPPAQAASLAESDRPSTSPPPPPASGIWLSDEYSDPVPLPPTEGELRQDGGPPPSAALSLADELLAEGPPVARLGDDTLLDDLSALEDEDWLPPPTDSVAALLVDAIAAYEEVELRDEDTGRYEELADLWLEGLHLGGGNPETVGRVTIIPERTDDETRRMVRHR